MKRCQVTKHCSSVKEGTYRNTEKRRRGREFWDLTPREENIKEEGKRVFFVITPAHARIFVGQRI